MQNKRDIAFIFCISIAYFLKKISEYTFIQALKNNNKNNITSNYYGMSDFKNFSFLYMKT